MADPFKFLTSFAQALSTMALYGGKHPARERAVDRSFAALRDLQASNPKPQFSLLGEETVQLARDGIEIQAVEPLTLKGKSERVLAYRLLAVKQTGERRRHMSAREENPWPLGASARRGGQ